MAWEQRIEQLSAESKPKWGIMTVTQMLAHCQRPLEIALGDEYVKMKFHRRLSGPFKKLYFTSKSGLHGKNTRSLRIFRVDNDEGLDFLCEQTRLLVFLRRFSEKGIDGKLVGRHPLFGFMTQRDWDLTQQKHLDHHLRQFGV
jgi:hypothetical protein